MKEEIIKAHLIDHLISEEKVLDSEEVLCSELSFADGRRRADLARLNSSQITAYEIKSKFDNLEKLPDQIKDYQGTFDFVYLVVDPTHLKKARELLNSSVGIYKYENNKFTLLREAKERKRLNKHLLLSTLTKSQLIEVAKVVTPHTLKKSLDSKQSIIRELSNRCKTSEIHDATIKGLYEKYYPRYQIFISERGNVTHPEDLKLLTSQPPGALLS